MDSTAYFLMGIFVGMAIGIIIGMRVDRKGG